MSSDPAAARLAEMKILTGRLLPLNRKPSLLAEQVAEYVPSLIGAVERVLELADELDAEAAQADAWAQRADERGADTACAVLYARATALNKGARRSREAITDALAGARPADPPQSEEDRRAAAEALEGLRTRLAGKGDGDE